MSRKWQNHFIVHLYVCLQMQFVKGPDLPTNPTMCYSVVLSLASEQFHAHHRNHSLLDSTAYWSTCFHFVCLSLLWLSSHSQSLFYPISISMSFQNPHTFLLSLVSDYHSKLLSWNVNHQVKSGDIYFMPHIFHRCIKSCYSYLHILQNHTTCRFLHHTIYASLVLNGSQLSLLNATV